MPNTRKLAHVLVCDGKNCFKKEKSEFKRLLATADAAGLSVDTVACQGACSGPTAVVIGSDGPRWFEDLKGEKVQRDLCVLAAAASADKIIYLPKRLARRELTGNARAKAGKRLAKQR